jgi:hypothetical protein
VLVDADERVVELVYRASFVLPRKWEMLERVIGRGVGTMPPEVLDEPGARWRSPLGGARFARAALRGSELARAGGDDDGCLVRRSTTR